MSEFDVDLQNGHNQLKGAWHALPNIFYGFAVFPFTPVVDNEGKLANDNQVALDVGTEVYVFEVFSTAQNPDHSAFNTATWYRGYIVTANSRSAALSLGTELTAQEPIVAIGIFPANHIYLKSAAEQADATVNGNGNGGAAAASAASLPHDSSLSQTHRRRERLATLTETQDEAEYSTSAINASKAGGNRSSRTASRFSMQRQASSPTTTYGNGTLSETTKQRAPLPSFMAGDDTSFGLEEPLVDEIASTMREWSTLLSSYLFRRDYAMLQQVQLVIDILSSGRRQILSGTLSTSEIVDLRHRMIAYLTYGSHIQGLDLVVRDPATGGLVTSDFATNTSQPHMTVPKLYDAQIELARLAAIRPMEAAIAQTIASLRSAGSALSTWQAEGLCDSARSISADTFSSPQEFELHIELKAFVATPCGPSDAVELVFALYSKATNKWVSEDCRILLNNQGYPLHGKADHAKLTFKQLYAHDAADDVHLVCRINIILNARISLANGTRYSLTANSTRRLPNGVASTSVTALSETDNSSDTRTLDTAAGELTYQALTHPGSLRTAFGCAVLDVSQALSSKGSAATASEYSMSIFVPISEARHAELHKDVMYSRIERFEKSTVASHIAVTSRLSRPNSGSAASPALSGSKVLLAQRLSFPDVASSDRSRHDVYLRLAEARLMTGPQVTLKHRSSHYTEITVEVRDATGKAIIDGIASGSGLDACTRYKFLTFSNDHSPNWQEMIKLNLTPAQSEMSHLYFLFRHRRDIRFATSFDDPFAFAFLPLMPDRAFVKDGSHKLIVYRFNDQWWHSSGYLDCAATPSTQSQSKVSQAIARLMIPTGDYLLIDSLLLSTQLTQDRSVLAVLGLANSIPESIDAVRSVLAGMKFAAEYESVKFLEPLLDAMLSVLVSPRNTDERLTEEVFSRLLNLLALTNDRRFISYRLTLSAYIEHRFSYSTAFSHLLKAMMSLVQNAPSAKGNYDLHNCLKLMRYIFEMIAKSRQLRGIQDDDLRETSTHLEASFKRDLKAFFHALNQLMSAREPASIIGTQTIAIQGFAPIIPPLHQLCSQEEVVELIIAFCDSVDTTKPTLAAQRLTLLEKLISDPTTNSSHACASIAPHIVRWLRPHLGISELVTINNGIAKPAQMRPARVVLLENLYQCSLILGGLLHRIQLGLSSSSAIAGTVQTSAYVDALEYLIATVPLLLSSRGETSAPVYAESIRHHPIHLRKGSFWQVPHLQAEAHIGNGSNTVSTNSTNTGVLANLHGRICMIVIAIVTCSSMDSLRDFFENLVEVHGQQHGSGILNSLFELLLGCVQGDVYPPDWANAASLAHTASATLVERIAPFLTSAYLQGQKVGTPVDLKLWNSYLKMILKMLTSPVLALENFLPAKQRTTWRLYGDLRGRGSRVLLQASNTLGRGSAGTAFGELQVGFSGLIPQIVELCLSHHDDLRQAGITVLATLVFAEYRMSSSLTSVESDIMERLDRLFSQRKGDNISRAFFISQMREQMQLLQPEQEALAVMEDFLESLDHFLQLLLEVRDMPPGEEWQDDRIISTLKLMSFIEKRQRYIFVRYVHRLADMHLLSGRFSEAGLTLKLHADLYDFDTILPCEPIEDIGFPRQTQCERKEMLYLRVLDYLGRGGSYESAIAVSRSLQAHYERRTFAYQRLSELLTHQADLFASIVSRTRTYPSYFRVGFHGSSFPAAVRDREYVYRGLDGEGYSQFTERVLSKHAGAVIVSNFGEEAHGSSSARTIAVVQVQPVPDRSLAVFATSKVPFAIRSYYENNETSLFTHSEQTEKVDQLLVASAPDLARWCLAVNVQCSDSFPTIMNRVEVVNIQTNEVSPLEYACQSLSKKVNAVMRLHAQIAQASTSNGTKRARANANLLTMTLNDVLDNTSSNSITSVRHAFFTAQYVATHPSHLAELEHLRRLIDDAAKAIASCLQLHASLHSADMAAFHKTLVQIYESMFTDEISRLSIVEHLALGQSAISLENEHSESIISPVIQVSIDGHVTSADGGYAYIPMSHEVQDAAPALTPLKPTISNGVRFTDQVDASIDLATSHQHQHKHQHTPSITSTTNSGRPSSFLGRFASLRRKSRN